MRFIALRTSPGQTHCKRAQLIAHRGGDLTGDSGDAEDQLRPAAVSIGDSAVVDGGDAPRLVWLVEVGVGAVLVVLLGGSSEVCQ